MQSYEKSRAKQRNSFLFLPRRSKFAIFDGKVTKKLVKRKRFWKINAIQPEIKASICCKVHALRAVTSDPFTTNDLTSAPIPVNLLTFST